MAVVAKRNGLPPTTTSGPLASTLMGFLMLQACSCWVPKHSYYYFSSPLARDFHASIKSRRFLSHLLEGKNLVGIDECLEAHGDPGTVFVDGSWYHGADGEVRNGRAEFEAGPRIEGARYVDMSDIATTKELFPELNPKGLPQMLPPKDLFARTMDAFGIQKSHHVIVYGRDGCIFTPRTWFLFRSFGHERVHLMQGSLEEWMEAGGPVDTRPTTVPTAKQILQQQLETTTGRPPTKYSSNATEQEPTTNVMTMEELLHTVRYDPDSIVLIDPRGSSFASRGHIPGAIHIPYKSLVKKENALCLRPQHELKAIFAEAGVDIHTEKRIVATCGSGVSVCHVLLALEECGRRLGDETCMYDGSWSEWGSDPETPKVLPEDQEQ